MNPFSLFHLQPAPRLLSTKGRPVSQEELRQAYVRLQEICHPDTVALSSSGVKAMAVKKSSDISSAYKLLSHDLERVKCWLNLEGLDIEKQTTRPDMAMFELQMELNDMLELVESGNGAELLQQRLAQLRTSTMSWFSQIQEIQPDVQEQCLHHYGLLALVTRLDARLKDLSFKR